MDLVFQDLIRLRAHALDFQKKARCEVEHPIATNLVRSRFPCLNFRKKTTMC